MADIVTSMFGIDKNAILKAQQAKNDQIASMFSQNKNNPGAHYVAAQLGAALGGGASKGMFGETDPELVRASKIEAAMQEAQAGLSPEDMQDPTKFGPAVVNALNKQGLNKEATQAQMQFGADMLKYRATNATIAKDLALEGKANAEAARAAKLEEPQMKAWSELAKKASPASVKASASSGYDIGLLDIPKEDKDKLSSQATMLIDAGYVYGSPEFNEQMRKFISSDIAGKAKGTGNVTIGSIAPQIDMGKMSEEAGKAVGKKLIAISDADKAKSYVSEAIGMIDAGISSGSLANVKNSLAKVSSSLGIPIGDVSRASNTEIYKAYLGNVVIPMMSQLGGSDSNEELKKMEAILAADVTLEEKSMRKILNQAVKAIDRDVEWTRKQANSASTGTAAPTELTPTGKPAGGGVRKVWNPKTQKVDIVKD